MLDLINYFPSLHIFHNHNHIEKQVIKSASLQLIHLTFAFLSYQH